MIAVVLSIAGRARSVVGQSSPEARPGMSPEGKPGVAVPLVAIAGAGIAAYLAYVESRGVPAVCGPVGDCNAVQQSEYAWLFGVLPIGVLGLLGYAAIIAAWSVARSASGRISAWAGLGLLAMTLIGTLFSVYLTFLEPFVIGATCAWCLASAILITLLLWLAAPFGLDAWQQLRRRT